MLEATMIVLDTSEFMRNGDYYPTRMIAAQEAAFSVFSWKTRDNPETTVGLMSSNGSVKVSFVNDVIKYQAGLRETEVEDQSRSLCSVMQVAQLALRHRQNKNQRQRIVLFNGSPVTDSPKDLVRLGAKLRKNNIAVDIINIGQEENTSIVLEQFVSAVNSNDNSHFLDVPPSLEELSVTVKQLLMSEGDNNTFDDFNAEDDPELAMALRMSLQEEQQRQARAAQETS